MSACFGNVPVIEECQHWPESQEELESICDIEPYMRRLRQNKDKNIIISE